MRIDALTTAYQGMQSATERLNSAGGRIAQARPDEDLAGDIVDLKVAGIQMRASTAVAKTASEMMGTLLDMFG